MKIVIIIPTYNEKKSIGNVIEALQRYIATLSQHDTKILIYDSHSPDGTAEFIQSLQVKYPNLYLQIESEKSGLGSAYIKAMRYAMDIMQADLVFEYDADGSHQPQYIKGMLEQIEKGYDVVMGSRYVPGGSIPSEWAFHRKVLSVLGNWVARFFLTRKYKDFTSGFRGTRTSFLKQIELEKLLSKQYAYKLHLLWSLHKLDAKIVEYPIEFIDRTVGKSKFPPNNILDSLSVVVQLRWREIVGNRK